LLGLACRRGGRFMTFDRFVAIVAGTRSRNIS
jgi:hypothetical protein